MKKFGEDEAGLKMPTFQSQAIFSGKPNAAYYFCYQLCINFHLGHNFYKNLID